MEAREHTPTIATDDEPISTRSDLDPTKSRAGLRREYLARLDEGATWTPAPPPVAVSLGGYFRNNDATIVSRGGYEKHRAALKDDEDGAGSDAIRTETSGHRGLPFFLNGRLDQVGLPALPDVASAEPFALQWLFDHSIANVLFGADGKLAEQRLGTHARRTTVFDLGKAVRTVHVHLQQMHAWQGERALPVFGGTVVAHLVQGRGDISASSSYFPIHEGPEQEKRYDLPKSVINPEEAMQSARQALARFKFRLKFAELLAALEGGLKSVERIDRLYDELKDAFGQLLSRIGKILQHVRELRDDLLSYGRSRDLSLIDQLVRWRLDQLLEQWRQTDFDLPGWATDIAAYAESDLVLLPFANRYYVAYLVQLTSPDGKEIWRCFVNADDRLKSKRRVLGEPERLALLAATYFETSDDVPTNPTPVPDPAKLSEEFGMFATLTGAPFPLTANSGQDETSIVYHANKIYKHFAKLYSDLAPNALLNVQLGLAPADGSLATFFSFPLVNAANSPPQLYFHTGRPGGFTIIVEPDKRVFDPCLDPEIVYHEMTHWLQYVLNASPFVQQHASVPFAQAMLEGYANYFARSVADKAAPGQGAPVNLWAKAAFKEIGSAGWTGWSDRWGLSRLPGNVPGHDVLPAPNLYPQREPEPDPTTLMSLGPYHVGMVFARALWELRDFVIAGETAAGVDHDTAVEVADGVALNAYMHYAHGHIANFEAVAEGVVDGLTKLPRYSGQKANIAAIMNRRNILAEHGAQAVLALPNAPGGTLWLAGFDGAMKWTQHQVGAAPAWRSSNSLSGVIALAAESDDVFWAATESHLHRMQVTPGPNFTELSSAPWPQASAVVGDERPLCMMFANGRPFVGSGNGVYEFTAGSFRAWGTHDKIVRQMADVTVQPNRVERYVAAVTSVEARSSDASPNVGWNTADPDYVFAQAVITALAARNDEVFIGTLRDGVWKQTRRQIANDPNAQWAWTNVISAADLRADFGISATQDDPAPMAPVLCLLVAGNALFVGAASGLLKLENGVRTVLQAGETITCITHNPNTGEVLAGTAKDALLFV